MPGLEPFVCLGNLIQGQQIICERAHLPAFYQAGHLIEPRLLSQEEHAMERLVKPVGASSTHRRANARVLPGSSSGLLRPAIPLAILPALLSLLLAFFSAFLPALLSLGAEGRFFSGPSLAVSVLVLFLVVQTLESYLMTPLIQRRAVELPPALLIFTQLAAGLLLGPLGVVIAAPLVASAMAAARELIVVGDPAHEDPKDRAHDAET